jgi:hypothetical protein
LGHAAVDFKEKLIQAGQPNPFIIYPMGNHFLTELRKLVKWQGLFMKADWRPDSEKGGVTNDAASLTLFVCMFKG